MSNQSKRPDFVYFDLGNVLVYFDHAIACRQLAELSGKSSELIRQVVFQSDLQLRYESGQLNNEQFLQELSHRLGVDLPLEETLEAASAIFEPNHEIIDCLSGLRNAGFRLGILSNTCDAHWQWLMRQNYEVLNNWFDIVALSYELGCVKPHSLIYEKCAGLAECSPDRIFFTDDRSENIQAAQEAGWITHHFTGVPGLKERISQFLA